MLEWLPFVKLIEPVYPTLVHAFYANAEVLPTYALFANLEALRYVLMKKKIWKIVGVPSIDLKVEDMKIWLNILGFVVSEAIQRVCDISTAHGTIKHNAQSLSLVFSIMSLLTPSSLEEDIETRSLI